MLDKMYLVLGRSYFLPLLLWGEPHQIRQPFKTLRSTKVHTEFASNGLVEGFAVPWERRKYPVKDAPFIPYIGPMLLSKHAIAHHRSILWNPYECLFPFGEVGDNYEGDKDYEIGEEETEWAENDVGDRNIADMFLDGNPNRDLDSLIVTEGGVFELPDNERLWHVPLAVKVAKRVSVNVPLERTNLRRLEPAVQAHLRIHLFPYGVCNCFLCLSIIAPEVLKIEQAVSLLRQFAARPRNKSLHVQYSIAHSPFTGNAEEFLDQIGHHISASVSQVRTQKALRLGPTTYSIFLEIKNVAADDERWMGLLTLDRRFRYFSQRYTGSKASLFGRYDHDLVMATSNSMLVNISPTEVLRKRARRKFTWSLLLVMELARCQKFLLPLLNRQFRHYRQEQKGRPMITSADVRSIQKTVDLVESLQSFHKGFPAHHRKWYYKCQEVLGLQGVFGELGDSIRALHQDDRIATIAETLKEAVASMERIHIHINQSQIGTINLGKIVGNIENHLSQVTGPSSEDIVAALKSLAEAIANDKSLEPENRQELLENVEFLSQSASEEPDKWRKGVIRAAIDAISRGLTIAASAASVWATWGPTISAFFGS